MTVTERLARLRKRFGITPDKFDQPRDVCVQLCAAALDARKEGGVPDVPQAIRLAYGTLSDELRRLLMIDHHLNLITAATVSGMMDCLTTEWHN